MTLRLVNTTDSHFSDLVRNITIINILFAIVFSFSRLLDVS